MVKNDRITMTCSVLFKKRVKKVSEPSEGDMSDFARVAIREKVKRDGLEELWNSVK